MRSTALPKPSFRPKQVRLLTEKLVRDFGGSALSSAMAIAGPERRFELGKKLHSSLDILQTPTYSRFLKTFFPVFAQLLQQLPLQQQPDQPDHKLRWLIVDVLQRLPQNETIKPYVNDLLRLALRVITSDNEENALKCMHIFSDVLRTHKPQDPDAAVMFLDFVKGVNNDTHRQILHALWSLSILATPATVMLDIMVLCIHIQYMQLHGTDTRSAASS